MALIQPLSICFHGNNSPQNETFKVWNSHINLELKMPGAGVYFSYTQQAFAETKIKLTQSVCISQGSPKEYNRTLSGSHWCCLQAVVWVVQQSLSLMKRPSSSSSSSCSIHETGHLNIPYFIMESQVTSRELSIFTLCWNPEEVASNTSKGISR